MSVLPYAQTRHWHWLEDGRIQCDLCPRECRLQDGQRGLCFVRMREQDELLLTTYGRSSDFCVDPVEKKPLNHFYPGTPVFSFGTAGCNLSCKYCQNWDMSKSRQMDILANRAMPDDIALGAEKLGCRSVAYTYNDPVIFLEYAVDTAKACRQQGLKNIAVTAGYISAQAREDFFSHMDAANVDLKGFSESFYRRLTGGHLQPVLDTLRYLRHETDVWFEITNLLIPGHNDSEDELKRMLDWIVSELGNDIPLHFSAFHPDYKMTEVLPTPVDSLKRARQLALSAGMKYVYTGNVHDPQGGSSWCPECGELLIQRDWYVLGTWNLDSQGCCNNCGNKIPGRFDALPGDWGAKRLPVAL